VPTLPPATPSQMRGPPPKPTAIKAAEGNPGKRRLNRSELLEDPQAPVCPSWLDSRGRRIWRTLVPLLMNSGVLRELDQIQLANLCDATSILISAKEAMDKLPAEARLIVKTPNGSFQTNPLLSIINTQRQIISRLAAEFGLSPAARARLTVEDMPQPQGESPLEKIMNARGEIEDGDPAQLM
jgi:P27 family predicted phage terminase small subunit